MEKINEDNRVPNPDQYEAITIKITKAKYPIIFAKKVNELIVDCAMTKEEAEWEVEGMEIELELLYPTSSGLYAIESDAIESSCESLYNPYTGENLVDWESKQESKYDEEI